MYVWCFGCACFTGCRYCWLRAISSDVFKYQHTRCSRARRRRIRLAYPRSPVHGLHPPKVAGSDIGDEEYVRGHVKASNVRRVDTGRVQESKGVQLSVDLFELRQMLTRAVRCVCRVKEAF